MTAPYLLDGVRPPVRLPAPNLGQHNDQVIGALRGFDGERLASMARRGIIGNTPM